MFSRFSILWMNLSIRSKFFLLCSVFILPMLLLISMLFYELLFYRAQTDGILQEYSSCVQLSTHIRHEVESLNHFAYLTAESDERADYEEIRAQSDALIAAMPENTTAHALNTAQMKQVFLRALRLYRTRQDEFFSAWESQQFDAALFTQLQRQGTYLHDYAGKLTETVSLEGQMRHIELGKQMASVNFALIAGIVVCVAGMVAGVTMLVRQIILPVRHLSQVAYAVSSGTYDQPDLIYRQTDEIGSLARAFNEMKGQIARTIGTLEAEAQLQKHLRHHQIEQARLNQMIEQSRFAQLQSQINPHFLFNTLQNIANMAELEQAAVSQNMIMRLANYFRYSLEHDSAFVTLARELALLRDYISLQELRFSDRIAFEMDCDHTLDAQQVPKFILQPIVENAIVHGMKQRARGGRVRVTIRRMQTHYHVTVTDNGCGFHTDRATHSGEHVSIGLANIAQRTLSIGGALRIYSRVGMGTSVRLCIPLEQEER